MSKASGIVQKLAAVTSVSDLAKLLNINDAHIYRARRGDVTPMMTACLIDHGFMPVPVKRRRVAPDIPRDFTEDEAARFRVGVYDAAVWIAEQIRLDRAGYASVRQVV